MTGVALAAAVVLAALFVATDRSAPKMLGTGALAVVVVGLAFETTIQLLRLQRLEERHDLAWVKRNARVRSCLADWAIVLAISGVAGVLLGVLGDLLT